MKPHLLFIFSGITLFTAALHAQTPPIEEIIVTADFRQAAVNSIAASIKVLDSKLMQQKNASHLEDLLLNAPNVNFSSSASRARFYQIRGIGELDQFAEPLNSSVGIMLDGVDMSGVGTAAMLYDVQQVEVLMGPQGTRYGSNALAGLINLQSKNPTGTFSKGLQVQSENYAGKGIAGYLAGPATDSLQYRMSAQTLQSEGFVRNLFLGKNTNSRNETTIRGKIRYLATPTLIIDLTTAFIDIDNGYDAFSLDNTRTTLSDAPGQDSQNSKLGTAKLTFSNIPAFNIESTVAFANNAIAYSYDEDWTYIDFHPDGYQSTDRYDRNHKTVTAEIRLLSKPAGSLLQGRTSWIAGLYSLQQDVDLTRLYTFLPENFSSQHAITKRAIYGDTSTQLNEQWSLDAGIRGERFSADYHDSNVLNFAPAETLAGGRVALNYYPIAGSLIYATIARGYKSGGFNTDGSLDADLREYATEKLWNYELGIKGGFFSERLQTQAALFVMQRDAVQISSSTVRMRKNGSAEFITYIGNAAAGTNSGLELSATVQASTHVKVYSSLGLLATQYHNFINSAGVDLDGRDQAYAPRHQYTLGMDWNLSPYLELDVNIQGRDSFYFSPSHDNQSQAYTLLNANLSYSFSNIRMTLWGRNLTNQDYAVHGFYFGNDPRDGYTAKVFTQWGEPQRYGLTMNLDF